MIAVILVSTFMVLMMPNQAIAQDLSKSYFLANQVYNNLLNNESFIDTGSMSVAEIQAFLQSKGSVLATASPSILGEGANGRSAAQIIYDAARGLYPAAVGDWNGLSINSSTGTISPRVILVYLEKEQSLVTRTSATQSTLDCAMGYEYGRGCTYMFENYPNLKGFSNQVGNGAWQLRYNYEYSERGTKPIGYTIHKIKGETHTIPDESGNQYTVTLANSTTASILDYTPFVFNGAYNLWMLFNSWFTPTAPATPAPVPNDTARFESKTYSEVVTVGGTKNADHKVFFGGYLIADSGTTSWQLTVQAEMGAKSYIVEYRNASNQVVAQKELSISRHKNGDINGDSRVDLLDLSVFASYWGQSKPDEALTDLNGDGIVDLLDLSVIASYWEG